MGRGITGIGLVDLVIILAILGMLAVVGVPSLGTQEQPAPDEFTVLARLVELRLAIDTYWAEHEGFPGQEGSLEFARQLGMRTNAAGEVGEGEEHIFGPYLPEGIPENPYQGVNSVRITTPLPGHPEGGEAWVYDPSTGQVRANVTGFVTGGARLFDL